MKSLKLAVGQGRNNSQVGWLEITGEVFITEALFNNKTAENL